MTIKGLDNWHDFQFLCPAASISPGFCLRVLFSFLLFHCFDLESGAGHSGHYRGIHNYNQTFCSIKIWSVHEMGLDGTRGCVRSGRDHNYYLYQTKLPAWLPSAQHSTHFLERWGRERMITGLVMSPLSPGSLYTLDNPPGIKLNMETVNNAWCEDLPNISNLGWYESG